MPETGPSLSDRVEGLVAAGRAPEAYRLLAERAMQRDSAALAILASWRLSGQIVRRDLSEARDLFRRAAEAGSTDAAGVHTAFVANGAGGAADWPAALKLLRDYGFPGAAKQLALIDRMRLQPDGTPLHLPAEELLSEQPRIGVFRGLLSAGECNFLIAEAQPWLAPSMVVDPRTGQQSRNPIRTSDSMSFVYTQENPAVHALNRRIAAATATGVAQGEPLQVLRYRPGEEYKPHFDALAGEANQRVLTMLVYLNAGYDGGETQFLETGLSFKGRRGDALVFRNALPDGRPDPLARHAGTPVVRGEKLIASRWIRARPLVFPPPRPLLDV